MVPTRESNSIGAGPWALTWPKLGVPTIAPSVHIHPIDPIPEGDPDGPYRGHPRCHCFIRAGQIDFLKDCTHAFAGQVVDLPPWPPGA